MKHPGLQGPAVDFTAVTAEKSDHALVRPVVRVWFPSKVGSQVAEVEVVEDNPGIRAGYVEAGDAFVAGDQVHQADTLSM